MKKIFLIAALIITGLSFQAKAQDSYDRGYDDSYNYGGYNNNDGFGYFYTTLSPYGSWIEFGDGVYGWRPNNMRMGWSPYANGRWIWTSDGWYWDSYEPFGFIVYHYGRWYFDDYYGWTWIPDYQWAPAWVEWRYDNDYIGWAPLAPYAVFSISIGIHYTHTYYTPYSHWQFVKYHYFCDPYVGKYYAGPKYKYRIYSRTKYRNDYGYRNGRVVNRGIDVNTIRERGKVDIRERRITTVSQVRDINDKNRVTDNEIRTFIPDRKNFTNARVKDVKIERTSRKTALETSKLEFGRTNIDRKSTPVQRQTETKTNTEVNRKQDIRTTTTPRENVKQNRKPVEKRVVPDTRTKTPDRKDVRTPVKQAPVKKDTRTVAPDRTSPPKIEKRVNERIQQSTPPQQQTKVNTPPVQKRTEVRVNQAPVQKRTEVRVNQAPVQKRTEVRVNQSPAKNNGSGRNTTVQRQTNDRTKSETKRETNGKSRR